MLPLMEACVQGAKPLRTFCHDAVQGRARALSWRCLATLRPLARQCSMVLLVLEMDRLGELAVQGSRKGLARPLALRESARQKGSAARALGVQAKLLRDLLLIFERLRMATNRTSPSAALAPEGSGATAAALALDPRKPLSLRDVSLPEWRNGNLPVKQGLRCLLFRTRTAFSWTEKVGGGTVCGRPCPAGTSLGVGPKAHVPREGFETRL